MGGWRDLVRAALCRLGVHRADVSLQVVEVGGSLWALPECVWCGRVLNWRRATPVEGALHCCGFAAEAMEYDLEDVGWDPPGEVAFRPGRSLPVVPGERRAEAPRVPGVVRRWQEEAEERRTVAEMRGQALGERVRRRVQELRASGLRPYEVAAVVMEEAAAASASRSGPLEPRSDRYWPSIYGPKGRNDAC